MSLSQDFNHNNNNNKEIAQKGDDARFLPQFPQMWRYCNWQLSMVSIFIYSEVYQATTQKSLGKIHVTPCQLCWSSSLWHGTLTEMSSEIIFLLYGGNENSSLATTGFSLFVHEINVQAFFRGFYLQEKPTFHLLNTMD